LDLRGHIQSRAPRAILEVEMYCPTCGAESPEGLRFCKKCGSGLTAPLNVEYIRPVKITGAVWAIALLAFLCFGAFFGSIVALVGMGVRSEDVIIPVALFGSLSIVCICGMLIKMVSRAAGISTQTTKQPAPGRQSLPGPYNQAQIPPPSAYVPSVTENTTRSFDRQPGESSSR